MLVLMTELLARKEKICGRWMSARTELPHGGLFSNDGQTDSGSTEMDCCLQWQRATRLESDLHGPLKLGRRVLSIIIGIPFGSGHGSGDR